MTNDPPTEKISRRSLLAGGVVTGVGAALHTSTPSPTPTPKVRASSAAVPITGRTLLNDNYATGFRSWIPLYGPNQPKGMGGFDGQALVLMTEDRPSYGDNAAVNHTSAFLSRLTMPPEPRIYLRWEWGIRIYRGGNFSKGPQFGLDTDDGGTPQNVAPATDAHRIMMMMRCMMFDEANATYYGGKWQYQANDALHPDAADMLDFEGDLISPFKYPRLGVGQNYGKVLRQYTEQVLNLQTYRFEGLRHNGVGFGVLPSGGGYDPNPDTNARANELTSLVPCSTIDTDFANGCNVYVQLDNRTGQKSKGTLYVYACQVVALS